MGTPTVLHLSFSRAGSISTVADISTAVAVVGLIMPAAWTPAIITIEGSPDGVSFYPMYDGMASTRLSFDVPPGTIIAINPNRMRCCKAFRLLSGDRTVPVPQAATRDFGLIIET